MRKFTVTIRHPQHTHDMSKAKVLSDTQLQIVIDYVIESLNYNQGRGKFKESKIISMLNDAGNPIIFD